MEIKNSQELIDVLNYIDEVLNNEFPTNEYTAEYLILSILDNATCHANIIMDNVLMSENMEYLRQYYYDEIKSYKRKPLLDNQEKRFNKELMQLMVCSGKEASARGVSIVGTEHVLLALINRDYEFNCARELLKSGLQYDYVEEKVGEIEEESSNEQNKRRYINNNHNDTKIPLKSEIHAITPVRNGATPNINKYTINLHEEIINGHYDKLIGRDDILNNIIKVLSRRKKNNVILVGKPGVGKTSIGYKLAEMIDNGNVPEILTGKQVIMLDVMALISGTHLRGMFEERVDGLFRELKNNPNYILFIDDMQNVVRNTGKDKDGDLTDVIGKILSEGDVRVVGTISFKDYRNGIENNSALSTKLQKIVVEPSTKEETFEILKHNKSYYENFHHVKFNDDVLYKTITLAKRYITNNNLPDSAIDVIDLTGASISNSRRNFRRWMKRRLPQ